MSEEKSPKPLLPFCGCRFDRMELAGSLGDLGTLLPIAAGLMLVNGLSATGLFFAVGLFYLAAGFYYRAPAAVQPMKVIGAYAIAMGLDAATISAAGLLSGLVLAGVGATGVMNVVARTISKPVIRGVQVSTGVVLAVKGVELALGVSSLQTDRNASEPFLGLDTILGLPWSVLLAIVAMGVILALLDSRRYPAGLAAVVGGMTVGLLLSWGAPLAEVDLGFHWPSLLPYGFPALEAFGVALFAMVLPQIPMTLGNAVIANADLSHEYFPEAKRVTPRALCLSMAYANIFSFFIGGMPMCHGAGGLAAHYRFGARTAGSTLIIGATFLALSIFFGDSALAALTLLPLSVLGVLLLFAGLQLAIQIMDIQGRKGVFIIFAMLSITLASNLAIGFVAGMALQYVLRLERFSI